MLSAKASGDNTINMIIRAYLKPSIKITVMSKSKPIVKNGTINPATKVAINRPPPIIY